jgi:hypothetical protein
VRRALVTAGCALLTFACASPVPRESAPQTAPTPVPGATPAPVRVQPVVPQAVPYVQLRLGSSLLRHVYLSGAAVDAAANSRVADAQAYSVAAGLARLHEAARQSQKPAATLALAIVDRYPGRYLLFPSPSPRSPGD